VAMWPSRLVATATTNLLELMLDGGERPDPPPDREQKKAPGVPGLQVIRKEDNALEGNLRQPHDVPKP
jgi:hypothetical protein